MHETAAPQNEPAVAPAGPFTARLWKASAPIRARIDALPFLAELADGTLEPEAFVRYIQQDGLYLIDYRRALAMLGARSLDAAACGLWTSSAAQAVAEEQALHGQLLADERLASLAVERPVRSLVTRGYGASLLAAAAYEPYPVAVGAVLPCYWVYAEVGARLAARAAKIADHPYGAWAAAYGDPAFQEVSREAVAELERVGAQASAAMQDAIEEAFCDATRFEEMFWASAHAGEGWTL